MNQEKIGKFIAECRKRQNMTQKELAESLGVSDRTVGNWENGRNMPDLSLFKPLCDKLNIAINDLLSGEIVEENLYQEKLEENIVKTINYSNKKIERKSNIIGVTLIVIGVLIAISAIAIFPSDSSWGSIYSVFGAIISLLGINQFTKRLTYLKRLFCNFGYFFIIILILILIDFIGVLNINQAPRFCLKKITGESVIYYDALFYDVIRCNVDQENETYKIIKNQKYDTDNIDIYCK